MSCTGKRRWAMPVLRVHPIWCQPKVRPEGVLHLPPSGDRKTEKSLRQMSKTRATTFKSSSVKMDRTTTVKKTCPHHRPSHLAMNYTRSTSFHLPGIRRRPSTLPALELARGGCDHWTAKRGMLNCLLRDSKSTTKHHRQISRLTTRTVAWRGNSSSYLRVQLYPTAPLLRTVCGMPNHHLLLRLLF